MIRDYDGSRHENVCCSLQQDTFHPDKKPVAVKVMNIDYARLGAQVLYVNISVNIVYVA